MRRFRVLDLFCGAGGAAMGYHLAWPDAEIVGVDIVRQWEYPFTFVQGDAMTYPLDGFDFVHASPPCKAHTVANRVSRARAQASMFEVHPDLVGVTIDRLCTWGGPFVVENVPGAPVPDPAILCGSMFGLKVRRHRLFATSFPVQTPKCAHHLQPEVVGVYGLGGAWTRTAPGGGGRKVVGVEAADALGITHTTTQAGLSQSIPPAYTRFLAEQFDAWRSTRPDAPATPERTQRTGAHGSVGGALRPTPCHTAECEGVPSDPFDPVVGHVRVRLARGEHDLDVVQADFGHLHDGLNGAEVRAKNDVPNGEVEQGGGFAAHGSGSQQDIGRHFGQLEFGAGELLGQRPVVPSLGVGGGSAGDIGAVLELSGVDHKTIQPQILWDVNHKPGDVA